MMIKHTHSRRLFHATQKRPASFHTLRDATFSLTLALCNLLMVTAALKSTLKLITSNIQSGKSASFSSWELGGKIAVYEKTIPSQTPLTKLHLTFKASLKKKKSLKVQSVFKCKF